MIASYAALIDGLHAGHATTSAAPPPLPEPL